MITSLGDANQNTLTKFYAKIEFYLKKVLLFGMSENIPVM